MNNSEGMVCGLLLGEYQDDRRLVRDVFRRSGWDLREVKTGREALDSARHDGVQVVIAQSSGWQDLLDELHQLPEPPQLVVTSRTADDQLWSEVLNHGGFDVLPQPFDREELQRVVAAAGRYASSRPQVIMAAASSVA